VLVAASVPPRTCDATNQSASTCFANYEHRQLTPPYQVMLVQLGKATPLLQIN
jgi:hypothetical protein